MFEPEPSVQRLTTGEPRSATPLHSIVAHELRTPLASATFAARLLAPACAGNEASAAAHATLARQLQQMSRIIEDLLEDVHSPVVRLQVRPSRIDLRMVMENAAEDHAHAVLDRRQKLVLGLPPQPVWLFADPGRLEQAFSNLIGNATKYTPPGGCITVRLRLCQYEAVVGVRDSGIGIVSALLPQIFDLYRRADTVDGQRSGGLGIGLAVVHDIVQQHGGNVNVTSGGPGRGSLFEVRLPLDR